MPAASNPQRRGGAARGPRRRLRLTRLRGLPLALLAGCATHVPPPTVAPIAQGEVAISLFLVGDAGKPDAAGDPVLAELARQARAAPEQSAIVFLGDNLYPKGLPAAGAPERAEMERRLAAQVDVGRMAGRKTWFVPGNHDWEKSGPDGWNAVRRSGEFIRERGAGMAEQLPAGGCPGPAPVELQAAFRIVFLDTEWWLHGDHPKPRDASSGCPAWTEAEVMRQLDSLLAHPGNRETVIVAHHPIASAGPHGGHFTLLDHLFPLRALKPWAWLPLPLIGSIYPIARQNGVSDQDLSGEQNQRMRAALEAVMARHQPLLYAAGHDHTLQVFRGPGARYTLVSGTGMARHTEPVGWRANTLYAAGKSGFIRLDADRAGRVRLSVTVVEPSGAREALGLWLTAP